MNIPGHISESLETIFLVNMLEYFNADPESGIILTLDPGLTSRMRNTDSLACCRAHTAPTDSFTFSFLLSSRLYITPTQLLSEVCRSAETPG
jgi:hypothetical protein